MLSASSVATTAAACLSEHHSPSRPLPTSFLLQAATASRRAERRGKLADGLSTESIERIATAMPHILAEAVNELDGKVEYVM